MPAKHWLFAALVGGLALGVGSAARADDRLDDRLESRVEKRLDRAKLDHLKVDVDEGLTVLSGEVATHGQRVRAERLARAAGARRVENRIEVDVDKAKSHVDDVADEKKERIEDNAERAKDRVERRADDVKERMEKRDKVKKDDDVDLDAGHKKHENFVDPWITTKVKAKILIEDDLRGSEIDVDTTNDGFVTLKGTVPSEAARTRALDIARKTDGVRWVNDQLRLKVK